MMALWKKLQRFDALFDMSLWFILLIVAIGKVIEPLLHCTDLLLLNGLDCLCTSVDEQLFSNDPLYCVLWEHLQDIKLITPPQEFFNNTNESNLINHFRLRIPNTGLTPYKANLEEMRSTHDYGWLKWYMNHTSIRFWNCQARGASPLLCHLLLSLLFY
jgi:hypothetical protein